MKIGIKFASVQEDAAILAIGKAALFCIETGEVIEGVREIDVRYGVNDVITATVEFYPAQIVGTDEQLYPERAKLPANDHPAADTPGTRRS